MPSAGAVCPPLIIALRKYTYGQPTTHLDTSTLVDISCETPNCRIYFTADGSRPDLLNRKVGGREVCFRYTGAFTLKPGKRTIKAIAATRDGVKESDVITRTFVVVEPDQLNAMLATSTSASSSELELDYFNDTDGYDFSTDSTLMETRTSKGRTKKRNKSPTRRSLISRGRSKSPMRRSPVPKEAWASSGITTSINSGAFDETAPPPIPDGPFNPTNYSGTQINVWGGAPPPYLQGGVPGNANMGPPGICNPYTTQYGYLTENMIQGCNPDTKHVTVGDLRQMLKGKPQEPPPPEVPPIEYPSYKDPPLNDVSPGGGRRRIRKTTRFM